MSKYFITVRQQEQAERMANKWKARAEWFWLGGDGWGYDVEGFCKSFEDAERAEQRAKMIFKSVNKLISKVGDWNDVQVIRSSVIDRDLLDMK